MKFQAKQLFYILAFVSFIFSLKKLFDAFLHLNSDGAIYIGHLMYSFTNGLLILVFISMSIDRAKLTTTKVRNRISNILVLTLIYAIELFGFLLFHIITNGFLKGEYLFNQIISIVLGILFITVTYYYMNKVKYNFKSLINN